MTDSLLIEEDQGFRQKQKHQGAWFCRRTCHISLVAPLIYLPLLWLFQHLSGVQFDRKDWLNFAALVPLLGCFIGVSIWAASQLRPRWLLTAKGIKVGSPHFTFVKWKRVKRWHITEPSEASPLPVITFHRSPLRPIAITVPREFDLGQVREFISRHTAVAERGIDIDLPGFLSFRTWAVLTSVKWILFASALPAFRLPNPPLWSSSFLLFSILLHCGLEYGTRLHESRIARLREECEPRWLKTVGLALALLSFLGLIALPSFQPLILNLSSAARHLIVYSVLAGPLAVLILHMTLTNRALWRWYLRKPPTQARSDAI